MNLLEDPWLPVLRRSGRREVILPWQITEGIEDDPIVSLDLPRPDFNGSLIQFLIGLFQTAWVPEDDIAWNRAYETPPTVETLRDACMPLCEAFYLDGEGPRFMQDLGLDNPKAKAIASLLIDEPGDQAIKRNTDHFIKRDRYPGFGLTATIAALFTLQINAPAGGAGHRTSLRGGGPLTTLLVPDPLHDPLEPNLWRLVWLNVLSGRTMSGLTANPSRTSLADKFPWMAATRTSQKQGGVETTPADAHPTQMHWCMPRRIRLEMDDLQSADCSMLFGSGDSVTGYQTQNYGTNYTGAWEHPLSPHRRADDGMPIPLHPHPGGIGYSYWLGVVLGDGEGITPARVVTESNTAMRRRRQVRLWAFGYDMDNMKARGWYESHMPVYHLETAHREAFVEETGDLLFVASEVSNNLRSALKSAWFKPGNTVRGDLSFITQAFWQQTENTFYEYLAAVHGHVTTGRDEPDRKSWLRALHQVALALFDLWAASGAADQEDPKRIALARNQLIRFNHGKKIKQRLRIEPQVA